MLQINNTKFIVPNKDDFLAQLSHQLLNHATKLQLIGQALAQEHPLTEQTHQQIQEALSTMVKQVIYSGRITSLLNDSVNFEEWLNCKPLDMAELTDDVIKTFKFQILDHSIATRYPDKPLLVWGDAGHLQVVLDNLIANAIKYSNAHHPITVSVEPYKGLIDKGNGHALVSVTNYGSVISAQEQEKIFNKFYRSPMTEQPGQGLGLYFSRYLVEAHGGQLEVESSTTEGTTFWFTLPLADSTIERFYPERERIF